MIDIVVVILAMSTGCLAGVLFDKRLKMRYLNAELLCKYIDGLLDNVVCKKNRVEQYNVQFSSEYPNASLMLSSHKFLCFTAVENDFVKSLFDGMNRSGTNELVRHLSLCKSKADSLRSVLDNEYKMKKGLYVKLGLLFGAILGLTLL